jgi:hypothetical protein
MRRSARLVNRRFWVVLGVALLSFLVELLFELAIGLVPSMISLWLGTDGVGWVLSAMVSILTQLLTIPVVAGITVSRDRSSFDRRKGRSTFRPQHGVQI